MFLNAFSDELIKLAQPRVHPSRLKGYRQQSGSAQHGLQSPSAWAVSNLRKQQAALRAKAPKPASGGEIEMPADVVRMGGKHVPTASMGRAIARGLPKPSAPRSIAKQPTPTPPQGFGGQ